MDMDTTQNADDKVRRRRFIVVVMLCAAVVIVLLSVVLYRAWWDRYDTSYSETVKSDGMTDGFTYTDYRNTTYKFHRVGDVLEGRIATNVDRPMMPVVFGDEDMKDKVLDQMEDDGYAYALADVHVVTGGIAGVHEETVEYIRQLSVVETVPAWMTEAEN